MRRALLVAGLVLAPAPGAAEHGDPLIIPAPRPGSTIPPNARIRLESHNGIAGPLPELAAREKGYSAVLVAGEREIRLAPAAFFDDQEGGYGDGLLVLAPVRALEPWTTYALEVRWPGGAPEDFKTGWSWTTSRDRDVDPPRWRSAPRAGGSPDVVIADPGDELLVEIVAELAPIGRGRAKRLHLVYDLARQCDFGPTVDYRVAIAASSCPELGPEGLCQTAHLYGTEADVGQKHRVRLTAFDLAGNRAVAPGPRTVVTWTRELALTVCLPRTP